MPLARAEHRCVDRVWLGCSCTSRLYPRLTNNVHSKTSNSKRPLRRLEARVAASPWFDGENFSLVDAVFGPRFRLFSMCSTKLPTSDSFRKKAESQAAGQKPGRAAAVPTGFQADYPALPARFLDGEFVVVKTSGPRGA